MAASNGASKTTSSGKTLAKTSKQSTRPPQARNSNKHSKTRNNSNSSVESTINGLVVPHSKITSNGIESVAHALYAASASWNLNEKKAEFCNIRQVQNFQQQQQQQQQQQIAPQQLLVNNTQQAVSQQKQEQQQKASHNMQVQLLQHYQQQNFQKDHLQFLQHQKLLEQAHQKQLHEKKQQQQLHQQQQQQQHRLQDQQFVHQKQQQLSQQRRLQQQRQQELHIQLQNSRQQQQQLQRQQLQVNGLQNQQQVQFHQQQQLQTCTSSVTSSVKNISDTELLLQSLPSIQSSMSSLLVSQSLVNTTTDGGHTPGILTTRPSVLPRTLLPNTQGKPQNTLPITHLGSNAPSVSSHRPIAPRLEGHPSINNTLCNGGMPIITAIISAPLTQQIIPQSGANVERNSIHDANTLTPMNGSGNALNPPYPLMPFNVQMDLNLFQGVGAQFSEQNVQRGTTQVRGRQLLLE